VAGRRRYPERKTLPERIAELLKLDRQGVVDKRDQADRMGISMVQLARIRRAARAQGAMFTTLPPGTRIGTPTRTRAVPLQIAVRLPDALARKLRQHCSTLRLSMNAVIVEAIKAYLGDWRGSARAKQRTRI
jgi:hypothetical protein